MARTFIWTYPLERASSDCTLSSSVLEVHDLVKLCREITVQLMLIAGASSALTRTPQNVVIQKGDDVHMQCSTDAVGNINTIQWSHEAFSATRIPCTSTDAARYRVSQPVPLNDCFLTALGSSSTGNQGPYHCYDGSGTVAEAVVVLLGTPCRCLVAIYDARLVIIFFLTSLY